MNKTQRLDKILANMGYGSRKEVKMLIKNGAVEVDNRIVTEADLRVNPDNQLLKVNGIILNYKKHIYIMMNKPQGVISATEDIKNKTVLDLLEGRYSNYQLHPVGRLDKDTEGFILLTNDGQITHALTNPKRRVPKTYYAEILGYVDDKYIEYFKEGIALEDGYKSLSAELEIIEKSKISKIKLTIIEGKFHQVKRMFDAIDKRVIYLKRISIGTLNLDESLNPGEYRELKEEEILSLQNN